VTGYDVAVVGAGIIGLATAREILARRPGTSLVVLEKEGSVGAHQTGHNSGVIHSGLYYRPGSLKARLCVAGAVVMYEFCAEHDIAVERCGKVVVATDPGELRELDHLHQRGIANGVPGLARIGPDQLRDLEPHAAGVQALWSPDTGIVDFRQVAHAMAEDVRRRAGTVVTGVEVTGLVVDRNSTVVQTTGGDFSTSRLLTCAGLQSDRVARMTLAPSNPRIIPFRGSYWQLRADRRYLARNLIYPVPDPELPFLGVHFTRQVTSGAVWLGPNAVLALSREGYHRSDVRVRDLAQTLAYPGFRRMATKNWRSGMGEAYRDLSKSAFVAACRRMVPELTVADVVPGPSGVRAQSVAFDGALVDDFQVDVDGLRLMHVRNAPSPGATSSLAIAAMIVDRWDVAA
jgi:(S)-2-hydroxyglutarate dehydrogenase